MTTQDQKLPLNRPTQDNDFRRLKKTSTEEAPESLRKNKNKTTQPEDSLQNKITKYIVSSSQSRPVPLPVLSANLSPEERIAQLEEKLREREKVILELKEKKQAEEQRANNMAFNAREFKRKTKIVIAKSMLDVAQAKRVERRKLDHRLGYFTDNMRQFVEGEVLSSLKRMLLEKEQLLKKWEETRRSRSLGGEEATRAISCCEFLNREAGEIKREIEARQKEVATYKDKLRLVHKENNCYFNRLQWPIAYQRYQTLQLLGSGGFGQVYKCYDLENNRLVAMKLITMDFKNSDTAQRQDFFKHVQRQANIQKQLDHPNIARFHSLIQNNPTTNRVVFQLQYCSGPQLSVYLRKHQCLQQRQAKLIIRELFAALNYLSKLKERVIHYDLKPSNIMFSEGIVKILDFGLCKVMAESEDTRIQLTSQGVGTYWYLPPETFEQYDPHISPKVDVWSLGVIFFEMLYGRKPFGHGIPQSQIYDKGVILRAFKVEFPPETPKKYRVSEAAKEFISACLKYQSEDRLSPSDAYEHAYLRK